MHGLYAGTILDSVVNLGNVRQLDETFRRSTNHTGEVIGNLLSKLS